jgi:hypothetical protein
MVFFDTGGTAKALDPAVSAVAFWEPALARGTLSPFS